MSIPSIMIHILRIVGMLARAAARVAVLALRALLAAALLLAAFSIAALPVTDLTGHANICIQACQGIAYEEIF